MDNRITFKKFIGHLKTIFIHKWWVFYYCCKAGIPFRGLVHDLSKFSPIEFWESVRYYQGTSSPINACKLDKGYSLAWQHHKGHNPHHYEYWVDYLDNGGKPIIMPYKYTVELICDYLGAGRAYGGKKFSYKSEADWWNFKFKVNTPPKIHEHTRDFITMVLNGLSEGYDIFSEEKLKFMYKSLCIDEIKITNIEDYFLD